MKNNSNTLIILLFSLFIVVPSYGQLPPFEDSQNESDAFVGLDRKAWTPNINNVSESYQFNFEIPADPPYECVKIDRVEFTVTADIDFNNSGGCFSGFYTHVLDCDIHDPISCATDPFECCEVDAPGLNNWIVNNDDDDLFDGQILGFDVVALSNDNPSCPKDLISQGLFAANVSVTMEVYYKADFAEEELELDEDPLICPGQTIDLEGPSGYEIYEWDGPIDSDDRFLLDAIPGEYTLTVTDDRGCTSFDVIEVIADGGFAVSFNETSPFMLCGDNNNNKTLQALVDNSIEVNDFEYEWTTPSGNSSSADNVIITDSGTYTVEVTDEDSECTVTESIDVIVAQLSIAQIDSISMNVINTCETSYTAEAFIPTSDNNIYRYEWINGIDTTRTQSFNVTQSGTYVLNLLNDLGCPTTSDTVTINLTPPTVAGQDNAASECNGQTIELTTFLSNDASAVGTWENTTGRGNLNGSQFDPMLEEGVFTFNYIVTNPAPCDDDVSVITLTINPVTNDMIDDELCEGDMIIVNGVTYDNNNPSGVENMLSVNGCDSIISINLTFTPESITPIESELCDDDFIIVNGVTYNSVNPTGTEMLTNVNGCDSIVTINLTFVSEINTDIAEELCSDDSRIVNNVIYDINNPSGTEMLTSANGCDSIVTIDLTFINELTESVTDELCFDNSIEVNGVTYDINNPTGTETLISATGCDSIVTIDLTFIDELTESISDELCADNFIIVNGVTYDINNPIGTETLTSSLGCDSIVTIDLTFIDELTESISDELCTDNSIIVNGVTYDINNPTGTETITSSLGCDSIVTVDLTFVNEIKTDLKEELCSDDSRIVNNVTYDINNPTGTETLTSVNGCDSIVNVDLTFVSEINTSVAITLCAGQFIVINGVTYDVNNTNGTQTFTSVNGCDSILTVDLRFSPELVVTLIEEISIDCNADMTGEISSQVTGSVMGPFNYTWSDQSTQSILSNVGASTYSLTVVDGNNCTAENSITITEPEALNSIVNGTNITCNSNNGGSIEISNITGGVAPYLTSIDGVNFEDIRVYDNLTADSYDVIIEDMNGCTFQETIEIQTESSFTISPLDTIRIDQGQSVDIDLNLGFTAQSISWSPAEGLSCDDCESPTASPLSDISYTITVIDELGCEIVTEVFVRVTEPEVIVEPISVYIPNTFSPTASDGVNNVFKPLTSSDIEFIVESFIIYDRWGNIVHEESGILEGWDGFINSTEAVSGVYVYTLNYRDNDREELRSGSVTIIN
ncbi:gliding motility-associated C-terminal domain-containing protein [Saprospiraceae bacterium]|nr:gliding motility-associated C-terminal domain-containing protein [Saprospiraceae bacterium]